jgi:hypothetical protein
MAIVDVDTGETIRLQREKYADGYSFNMDGKTERNFRVVLKGR